MSTYSLSASVERALEDHAFSQLRAEVGGLLIGTFDSKGNTTVSAVLPALSAKAGQTHVTFTHEVWDTALGELDRHHPGQRVVGWYHTHPGFGLFLSEYDTFVHREFFSDERMVALVVDPVAGTRGWFQHAGELRMVQEEPTARPGLKQSDDAASAPAAARRLGPVPLLLAVPGLLLAGAIGGYAFGGAQDSTPVTDVAAVVQPNPRPTADVGKTDELTTSPLDPATDKPAGPVTGEETTAVVGGAVAAAPATTGFVYRVRSGDSMSEIAASVYGDAQQWPRIAAANPGVNSERIAVGQALCVPLVSLGADEEPATCR